MTGPANKKNENNNTGIRLNRYIASTVLCSRREADKRILTGEFRINGKQVTEMGTRVYPGDTVTFKGRKLSGEKKVYILLNKPKDCMTTVRDPQGRKTVMDLVKDCCRERIYPVGRLDRNTTGLLLLTNDGDLARTLTHPSCNQKKIYHIHLNRDLAPPDMEQIERGLELEDGFIRPDAIQYVEGEDRRQIGIEIHSGRNRIIRRIFEKMGYSIVKLDRVYFAGLTKKGLPRGKWRYLKDREINLLKMSTPGGKYRLQKKNRK